MSNTVAHLAVASRILKAWPALAGDAQAFYLGCVAPDTVGSKPGCTREDKKRVHLREGIRDAQWLEAEQMALFQSRVSSFVSEYIAPAQAGQRDFNLGYLVHLLTDAWNHRTIRQTLLKQAIARGVSESDREFFYMVTNDLEALDHYLLTTDGELGEILDGVLNREAEYALPGWIEKEYIQGSIQWWKNAYLVNIQQRQLKYITQGDITEFVDIATRQILAELKELL